MKSMQLLLLLSLFFLVGACNFEEKEKPKDVVEKKEEVYDLNKPSLIGFHFNPNAEVDQVAHLSLHSDSTFISFVKRDSSRFSRYSGNWNVMASVLYLNSSENNVLKVSLDAISGDNSVFFSSDKPTWKADNPFLVRGRYFYMADAAVFIFCNVNDIYNVYPDSVAFGLEKKFLEIEPQFNEQFYVDAFLSIESRENMEGNIVKQVVFKEIISIHTNDNACSEVH